MANRRPVDSRTGTGLCARLSSTSGVAIALAGALIAVVLTGCGIGTTSAPTSPLTIPAISGKAYGGPTPIVGATVKLYVTGLHGVSSGYGQATMVQEANQQGTSTGQDTDQFGQFQFAGGYDCPAGQFAYVVAAGGNSGGNAVNNNSLLVAALGRCEDLYNNVGGSFTGYKGGTIFMNELTTIAAAYALGHFSNVSNSGTGGGQTVLIGSDATNNAAQVGGVSTGCVEGVGSCSTTALAGLAHAFQNAANLVNVFSNAGTATGAYANLPGNSGAVVPQQLINTIGNILISCVNSTGGAAGDSSACGQLFSATTIGQSIPGDTFSAMVNLAANPSLSGSAVAVANLYGLAAPALSVYQPSLASASGLNDFSIAINYPQGLGASTSTAPLSTCSTNPCQGLNFPTSGALDINDIYYVANDGASGGATPVNIFAFGSNGTLLSTSTTNSNATNAYGLSVDALGNGYFGNGSTSGITALAVFSTGGGMVSDYGALKTVGGSLKVYSTAVDLNNNVWVFGTSSTNSLWMSPAGGTSFTAEGTIHVSSITSHSSGVAVDPNQNVWAAGNSSLAVIPNTGTVLAPTYTASQLTGTPAGSIPSGFAFTSGSGGLPSVYLASYQPGTTGVEPFTPTYAGPQVTALQPDAITTANSAITGTEFSAEGDGAGNVWLGDTNSHSVIQFIPNATPANDVAYRLLPCLGGSTTCANVFATGKPFTVSIDSTGSIWATAEAGGSVVQIISAAAPTWPLLSLGRTTEP